MHAASKQRHHDLRLLLDLFWFFLLPLAFRDVPFASSLQPTSSLKQFLPVQKKERNVLLNPEAGQEFAGSYP